MRNLEDCKAEVFRRSEERIKERKRNRKRVFVCCIPMCILLVVGGFCLRPLFEPVDESMKSGGTDVVSDRVLGEMNFELYGHAAEYLSVTLMQGAGSAAVSKTFTDTETLGDLYGCMAMYFDLSGADVIGGVDGADGTDRDTVEEEIKLKYGLEEKPADYTLVFREPAGEEREFRLYGNNLCNESNGCVVTLSDGQLSVLKAQLEQIAEKED